MAFGRVVRSLAFMLLLGSAWCPWGLWCHQSTWPAGSWLVVWPRPWLLSCCLVSACLPGQFSPQIQPRLLPVRRTRGRVMCPARLLMEVRLCQVSVGQVSAY
jgi:hypothetical protein